MSQKTLFAFALSGALSLQAQLAIAQNSRSVHEGEWPIENGVRHQPTRGDLGGGHEFSQDQAHEIDQLYDQLLSTGDKSQAHLKRAR
jgi:hypothetical protein